MTHSPLREYHRPFLQVAEMPMLPPPSLSKREYFAALAMQAMLGRNGGLSTKFLVVQSIKTADELIDALGKTNATIQTNDTNDTPSPQKGKHRLHNTDSGNGRSCD